MVSRNYINILLFVCLMMFVKPISATAEEFTFSWTVQPDIVADQNITELRVYQDSWQSPHFSEDPLSGTIVVDTEVETSSNFWAIYVTESGMESAPTDIIKVSRTGNDHIDPDPAEPEIIDTPSGIIMTVPPGYIATIEAKESSN